MRLASRMAAVVMVVAVLEVIKEEVVTKVIQEAPSEQVPQVAFEALAVPAAFSRVFVAALAAREVASVIQAAVLPVRVPGTASATRRSTLRVRGS